MGKQHVSIFKALGLTQAAIDAIEAIKEDDTAWKPDESVETIRTGVKNVLQNDQTFLDSIPEDKIPATIKKNIEKSQYARFLNEITDVAKKELGLEDKDFNEMTTEEKNSIKKLTTKISNIYLSKKGNVEGLQAMQKELGEAKQALAKKDEEHEAKSKTEIEGVKTGYSGKLVRIGTLAKLSTLDKIKLVAAPDYVVDRLLSKLNSKYKIVLNDNDELDVKDLKNPTLEVMTKDGKKVTFDEALRQQVLEDKIGTEEKEDPGGGGKKKVVIDGGQGGGGGEAVLITDDIQKKIDSNIALENKTKID